MKNKTKTIKKIKVPVLSRLTLKTFLVIVMVTVLINGAMAVKYYYDALQMGDTFRFALYTLYPLVTVVGPLLAFGIVYMISKENVTKLWRVSKAAIIATIAAMFQSFITPISMSAFAQSVGYGATPPASLSLIPMFAVEMLPVILGILLAVTLSVILSKSKSSGLSDASQLFQKIFLGGVLVFGLGQPIASMVGMMSDPQSLSIDEIIVSMLMGSIIPGIALCALFLLTARHRGILERSFTALFYAVMGVALLIALTPVPYLFTGPAYTSFNDNWVVIYLPSVMALVTFIGIFAWHKIKKVI